MADEKALEGLRAERVALEGLRELAGEVDWAPAKGGFDVLGRGADGESFAVEVKRIRGPNRAELLKGAAAMAILRLQKYAPKQHKIVWLHVDRVGKNIARSLSDYLAALTPDVGWVLVDDHAGLRVHLPMLDVEFAKKPARTPRSGQTLRRGSLFSDLNMWLLKVLLMLDFPEELWSGPRQRPTTISSLASIASVSQPKAHRFAKVMTQAGFLRMTDEGLELTRVEALLLAWRADYQARVVPLLAVRPIFEFQLESLRAHEGMRIAVGGQLAATEFDLRHTTRGRELIWVDVEPRLALDALELVPAASRSDLYLGRPSYCESVFRGRVVHRSIPFVDPCELMLETMLDPQRGTEQSDYLLSRLLAWHSASP